MTREELAARIMVARDAAGKSVPLSVCFRMADDFLAYAAKERGPKAYKGDDYIVKCHHANTTSTFTTGIPPKELSRVCILCGADVMPASPKPEPKACEHRWVSINNGPERCFYCDAKPEPPKPERGARQVWVSFYKDSEKPLAVWDTKFQEDCRLFREVIEP